MPDLPSIKRLAHVNRMKALRNVALFEARKATHGKGQDESRAVWEHFHHAMVRLHDDIKQPWMTREVSAKGFGGGIRRLAA